MNKAEKRVTSLTNTLKNKRLRPSYQRIRVLDYLYRNGSHPTAEEIYLTLSKDIPSLSKVTVYNTLHTFVEAGLARPVDIDESEMRFDSIVSNHGHFLCAACGRIFNFQADFDKIPVEGLERFDIKERNIYYKGLCPDCHLQRSHEKKESK